MIDYSKFEEIDIRVGKVVEVIDFPEGKYSTHILKIDFGPEFGIKTSLVRLFPNYGPDLVGKEVIGVLNLKTKQIGKYMSEVLTLGLKDENGNLVLVRPDKNVPIGGKLY